MAAGGGGERSGGGEFDADAITLTRWLLAQEAKHPEATGDFTLLMSSVTLACKVISSAVRKAGIAGLYGLEGAVNVQGEEQKKLDVLSNENFINALKFSNKVSVIVSEEDPEAILVSHSRGKYVVVMDPLDGSSNIDCNVSVGSIWGIYRRPEGSEAPSEKDALQPGSALVSAGYCMYGSSTQIVLSMGRGNGVQMFTLDPTIGEFLLTEKAVRIPAKPKTIYSINEGNYASFPAGIKRYIDACKAPPAGKKPYTLRYVGSMVADVHRTLIYGGIFLYPSTADAPDGKLRLLYEANPMSFLLEEAGGKASTGDARILDVLPSSIHQRVPVILGTPAEVERVEALLRAEP